MTADARPPRDESDDLVESDIEIELRSPPEVAARTLVLATVCRRALLEVAAGDPDDDPEAERFDLAAWLRAEGVEDATTPRERAVLRTKVGLLDPDEAAAASWGGEALAALGWALGLVDPLPPLDTPTDLIPLMSRLPAPWEPTTSFRHAATLRDEAMVARERERAEVWLWRVDAAEALEAARPNQRADILAAVAEVAAEAAAAGLVPDLVRGDFSSHGRPFRDLDRAEIAALGETAEPRLRALNWLCGFGTDWENVPLDV